MFKTSQGKYVAPSAIAARFKGICPYVGELHRLSGRAGPTASRWSASTAKRSPSGPAKHGLADKSFAEIARDEKTRELIGGYIDVLNDELNRWEQIKKFAIIDRELSIEAGDLTPSLKLKRKVVTKQSGETIAALYE